MEHHDHAHLADDPSAWLGRLEGLMQPSPPPPPPGIPAWRLHWMRPPNSPPPLWLPPSPSPPPSPPSPPPPPPARCSLGIDYWVTDEGVCTVTIERWVPHTRVTVQYPPAAVGGDMAQSSAALMQQRNPLLQDFTRLRRET